MTTEPWSYCRLRCFRRDKLSGEIGQHIAADDVVLRRPVSVRGVCIHAAWCGFAQRIDLVVGAVGRGIVVDDDGVVFLHYSASRTGRTTTLLAVLGILVITKYALGGLAVNLILYGNPMPTVWVVYLAVVAVSFSLAFGYLLMTAAAAQLTPESENRSTGLRIAMSLLSAVVVSLVTYAVAAWMNRRMAVYLTGFVFLLMLWTVGGSMMAAESSAMTPRIQRGLPSSFLARMLLTWLTPGPATGLIYASINIMVLGVAAYWLIGEFGRFRNWHMGWISSRIFTHLIVLCSAYLIGYLILVRWVVAVVRIR